MGFKLTRVQRLSAVIGISMCFFISEIAVGFYTHSLVLIADAFHYLNDLIGFIIALVAALVDERDDPPKALTFGWQRAQLLGAFFNGVLLFGLGISVFLQSLERFISLQKVENPKLVFIMGAIGLTLNIISVLFLHDHDHGHGHADHTHSDDHSTGFIEEKHTKHKHYINSLKNKTQHSHSHSHGDLAMTGVIIHVIGDGANNLGVMAAALVIWLAHYGGRFYADPAASMGISIMIFLSSIPLVKRAGLILLQSAPTGVDHDDVKHDLEQIPDVLAVHELHIWQLNQKKTLASAHILISKENMRDFKALAKTINECFHAYGIHSVTLQPEVSEFPLQRESLTMSEEGTVRGSMSDGDGAPVTGETVIKDSEKCQIVCGTFCADLSCCR